MHKDSCASSGQNLMVFSENGGTSTWYMTSSSASTATRDHCLASEGSEIDWEYQTPCIDHLSTANIDVYHVVQGFGDLVYVPPRSCHYVVNRGGITVKMAWSRLVLEGLSAALQQELPIYQRYVR